MTNDVAWTLLAFFAAVIVITYGPGALASYGLIRIMRRYKIGSRPIEPAQKPLDL